IGADVGVGAIDPESDPEIAADLAAARANGTLANDPRSAWGNAAIPGFGVGRPVSTPLLDPAAAPLPLAGPKAAAAVERRFTIAPETLVVGSSAEVRLVIAHGAPAAVVERSERRFVIGMLGAVLAIASALVLAIA